MQIRFEYSEHVSRCGRARGVASSDRAGLTCSQSSRARRPPISRPRLRPCGGRRTRRFCSPRARPLSAASTGWTCVPGPG
eukprot:4304036-Prymnesium_polylepis.1